MRSGRGENVDRPVSASSFRGADFQSACLSGKAGNGDFQIGTVFSREKRGFRAENTEGAEKASWERQLSSWYVFWFSRKKHSLCRTEVRVPRRFQKFRAPNGVHRALSV